MEVKKHRRLTLKERVIIQTLLNKILKTLTERPPNRNEILDKLKVLMIMNDFFYQFLPYLFK